MGTIYTSLSAPSGGGYVATVERLADGFWRQDDAETFTSGLAMADKNVLLTEGTSENRGTYTASFTATNWNDGLYRLRVHNSGVNNRVEVVQDFGVFDGNEVTVGEVNPIYHADINYTVDETNTQDEYTATWFKNGVRITSGVTNPCISVYKRSDGDYLIDNETMTQVGSTGSYKYDASLAAERQTAGESSVVVVSGTINSETRRFSWNLGRDSS